MNPLILPGLSCSTHSTALGARPVRTHSSGDGSQLSYARRDSPTSAFDVDARVWQAGHPYQTLPLKFVSIFRERIVAGGFINAHRLDGLIAETELHLAKPDTYVIHPLFFQAWGRKPADQLHEGNQTATGCTVAESASSAGH